MAHVEGLIQVSCESCATLTSVLVEQTADRKDTHLHMLSGGGLCCTSWPHVWNAITDMAAGLNPAHRCRACAHNPCQGGRGPLSC